jgi:2'-5' RNA ligase
VEKGNDGRGDGERGLNFLVAKRLFIGLELPPSCQATLAEIDPHLRGLRWMGAAQMHLTMSFLGDVSAEGEARLREALDVVRVPTFFLPIKGVGVFGGSHPSVVWAGVGTGHPHLFALHKHIQDAVLHAGLEADLRPFHPHITIGRAKGVSRQALQPFLRKFADTEFGMWKVTSFVLFSSVLTLEGSTYTVELRREF